VTDITTPSKTPISFLLDPELANPSLSSITNSSYWLRLAKAARLGQIKVGPELYCAILSVREQIFVAENFDKRLDALRVLGQFASRKASSRTERKLCLEHVHTAYTPFMGEEQNGQILSNDLSNCAADLTVLATVGECWAGDRDSNCEDCEIDSVGYALLSGDSWDLDSVAMALMRRYLGSGLGQIEYLRPNAQVAFPRLDFSETALKELRQVVGGKAEIWRKTLQHLGQLNDHAPEIWCNFPDARDKMARLSAIGVTASPESANTKKNSKAFRTRTFEFGGRDVVCEWHTKLEASRGRVHFSVQGGRVCIGTITKHLPT
jgi:hypothetical protein